MFRERIETLSRILPWVTKRTRSEGTSLVDVNPQEPTLEEDLSKTALNYFVTASARCPTSIEGQGTLIALRCKESGHTPEALRAALLDDESSIGKIAQIAKSAHAVRGSGEHMIHVNNHGVKVVIQQDFDIAQQAMILDRDSLLGIAEIYRENPYAGMAELMGEIDKVRSANPVNQK